MAFCVQCGTELSEGMNFCPACGTAVGTVAEDPAAVTVPIIEATDYRVILFSRGSCSAANARALLRDIMGYTASEARNLLNLVPVEIACNMTLTQAQYLARALTEYGMEITICNSTGYVETPVAATTSVYDRTGGFIPAVAAALAAITVANRTREFRRWAVYSRPPIFRLGFTPYAPPRSARRYSSFGIFHPAPRPAPRPVSPRPAASPARPVQSPRPAASPARPAQSPRQGNRPSGGGFSGGMNPGRGSSPSRPGGGSSRPGNMGGRSGGMGGGKPGGPGGGRTGHRF